MRRALSACGGHRALGHHLDQIGAVIGRAVDIAHQAGVRNLDAVESARRPIRLERGFDGANAHDRVRLFRLAWDVAGSSFGSRQVLYERFFASDPLTRARVLNAMFPKQEAMQRVLDFLHRDDHLA